MRMVFTVRKFTIFQLNTHSIVADLCVKFRILLCFPMEILFFFKYLLLIIPALISVAFFTLLERKVLSLVGFRLGPNKVSFFGILQPLADAFKLGNKSINVLTNFNFLFYYISSSFILIMTLSLFSCFFIFPSSVSLKFSILFFFVLLGFNSLNSIVRG